MTSHGVKGGNDWEAQKTQDTQPWRRTKKVPEAAETKEASEKRQQKGHSGQRELQVVQLLEKLGKRVLRGEAVSIPVVKIACEEERTSSKSSYIKSKVLDIKSNSKY